METFQVKVQDNYISKGYQSFKSDIPQYPLSCYGKLLDSQRKFISMALLIGPSHLFMQIYDLELYGQQNLFFSIEGNIYEIQSLIKSTHTFFLAKLTEEIGLKYGYVGVLTSQNQNFYDQFDIISKQSQLIILKVQNEKKSLFNFYALDNRDGLLIYDEYNNSIVLTYDQNLGYCVIGIEFKYAASLLDDCDFQEIITFINGETLNKTSRSVIDDNCSKIQCFINNLIEQRKLEDKNICFRNNSKEEAVFQSHEDSIKSICRINNQLVSTCCDKQIKIWNWKTGLLIKTFQSEKRSKQLLCSGPYLYSNQGNTIAVYNWKFLKIEDFYSQEEEIETINVLVKDQNKLLLGNKNGDFKCLNHQNSVWTLEFEFEQIFSCPITYLILLDSNTIVLGGENGEIKFVDIEQKDITQTILAHQGRITYLLVNPVRQGTFISCGIDNSLRCWDIKTGSPLKKIVLQHQIIACELLQNKNQICLADQKCIRIFNLQNWTYKKIESHQDIILSIASLNNQTFASGDQGGHVKISCLDWENQSVIVNSSFSSQINQLSQSMNFIKEDQQNNLQKLNFKKEQFSSKKTETPYQENKECLSKKNLFNSLIQNKKFDEIDNRSQDMFIKNSENKQQQQQKLQISSINNTTQNQLQNIQNQNLNTNNMFILQEKSQCFLNEISDFPLQQKSNLYDQEEMQFKELFENNRNLFSNIHTPNNNNPDDFLFSHFKCQEEKEAKFKSLSTTEQFLQIKRKTQNLIKLSQEFNIKNINNTEIQDQSSIENWKSNKQEQVNITDYQSLKQDDKLKKEILLFKEFLDMSKHLQEELNSFITDKAECNIFTYNNQADLSEYKTNDEEKFKVLQNFNQKNIKADRSKLNETTYQQKNNISSSSNNNKVKQNYNLRPNDSVQLVKNDDYELQKDNLNNSKNLKLDFSKKKENNNVHQELENEENTDYRFKKDQQICFADEIIFQQQQEIQTFSPDQAVVQKQEDNLNYNMSQQIQNNIKDSDSPSPLKKNNNQEKHILILDSEIKRLENQVQKKDAKLEQLVVDYNDLNIILTQKDEIIKQIAFILPQFENSQNIIEKLLELLDQKEETIQQQQQQKTQISNSDQCVNELLNEMKRIQKIVQIKDEQLNKEQKNYKDLQKQMSEQQKNIQDQDQLQKKTEIQMKIIANENQQQQIEIEILKSKLQYHENLQQNTKIVRDSSYSNLRQHIKNIGNENTSFSLTEKKNHKHHSDKKSEQSQYEDLADFDDKNNNFSNKIQINPLSKISNTLNLKNQDRKKEILEQFYMFEAQGERAYILDDKYYQNLKRYEQQFNASAKIPKNIFQSYRSYKLPSDARILVLKWIGLNPEYNYKLFNDEDIKQFMKENLKNESFLQMYNNYPVPILKVDFWRYFVMYQNGGFYADIDLEPFKPISQWNNAPKDDYQFIICPESPFIAAQGYVQYDRMAMWGFFSVPRHPLLLKIMEVFYQVYVEHSKEINVAQLGDYVVWDFSGPPVLTRAICEFLGIKYSKSNLWITKFLMEEVEKVESNAFKILQKFKIKIARYDCFDNYEDAKHKFWSGSLYNQRKDKEDDIYINWATDRDNIIRGGSISQTLNAEIENEVKQYPSYFAYLMDQEYQFAQKIWVKYEIEKKKNQIIKNGTIYDLDQFIKFEDIQALKRDKEILIEKLKQQQFYSQTQDKKINDLNVLYNYNKDQIEYLYRDNQEKDGKNTNSLQLLDEANNQLKGQIKYQLSLKFIITMCFIILFIFLAIIIYLAFKFKRLDKDKIKNNAQKINKHPKNIQLSNNNLNISEINEKDDFENENDDQKGDELKDNQQEEQEEEEEEEEEDEEEEQEDELNQQ